jgi:membrane protease YdiL (CAAX protease family)
MRRSAKATDPTPPDSKEGTGKLRAARPAVPVLRVPGDSLRPFFICLASTWLALLIAAVFYSKQYPHSHWIMTAALPAFLLEALFYLASVFEETRVWFATFQPKRLQSALLWLSAIIPYVILSLGAGTFQRNAFYLVAMLTGVLAFWYAVLPRRIAYDIGFLLIAAAPLITRVFTRLYLAPESHPQVDILGHLMWLRLGIMALLVLREWEPGAFGLWPTRREWRLGFLYFFISIVPIAGLSLALHDTRFEPMAGPWWRVAGIGIGTFFGIFWVVALGEDLLFQGVIANALRKAWNSQIAAVLIAAVLFGGAHLWYHEFPNWRRAVVVVPLGITCGLLYFRSGSVRASMVTHALIVMTWRVLFR